jgi:hypothetical protein
MTAEMMLVFVPSAGMTVSDRGANAARWGVRETRTGPHAGSKIQSTF